MKTNHNFFINLAFNLARKNLGKTSVNPSVGCIIVKNNSVISNGVTSFKGRPHAEYNALNKDINFKNSTMYLTLEPCTHYGLTPPCTNIIKKKKIKNVYYSFEDPDKRTFKKARHILKDQKINYKKITTKNNFYKSYYLNKINRLPLIDGKIALSKDFFTINKKSKWITNYRSRKVAHLIRSEYDAILSTSKSINKDNSLLNCRIRGLSNKSPDLIIIDRELELKKNLKLLKLNKSRSTYIFTLSKDEKKIRFFKDKKFKIIKLKKLNTKEDFKKLFKIIFELGKTRLLIETGLTFLNELIKFKLLNNLFTFMSNNNLRSLGKNNADPKFIKKYKSNIQLKVYLNGDKLYKMKFN